MSIGAHQLLVLEKRGGGKDDVGVVGGVGKELLMDDGEQVRPAQAFQHTVRVGRDRGGVAVIDKQRLDRWIVQFGERMA